MSTLDDLRETLGRHAEGVSDHDAVARPAAVHDRVRVVRRRRRAAASITAAAMLATVLGVVVAGHDDTSPAPVDRPGELVGQTIPAKASVGGFEFAHERDLVLDPGPAGDGRTASVQLPAADAAQAVSLAASGLGDGEATLFVGDDPVSRALGQDSLDIPVPVPADPTTTLRVVVRGAPTGARVGLAVYRRTATMPPGVSHGDAVFRQDVAGKDLLAARFAGPGQTSFGLSYRTHVDALLTDAPSCVSPASDLWITWSVDGRADGSVSCSHDPILDPGTGGSGGPAPAAGAHTVRVRLSRGANGPEVARVPAGTAFGLGVYEDRSSAQQVLGTTVPDTVEYDGRTWLLSEVDNRSDSLSPTDPLERELDTTHTSRPGSDSLVGLVARGRSVRLSVSGGLVPPYVATAGAGAGSFSGIYVVALAGDHYRVDVRDAEGGAFDAALVVYTSSDGLRLN